MLSVAGELDIATAPQLEQAVTQLCEAGAQEIEINLRDVTFIDSTGMQAILRAKERCARYRTAFFLVPTTNPGPHRLFEVTGIERILPWRDREAEPT